MLGKITEQEKNLIWKLYQEEVPSAEIAGQAHVSLSAVYTYTRLRERGFHSSREYLKYLIANREPTGWKREKITGLYQRQRQYALKRSENQDNRELSDIVKEALEKKGWNQAELAQKTEISPTSIHRYVHGYTLPNRARRERIFAALDITIQKSNQSLYK